MTNARFDAASRHRRTTTASASPSGPEGKDAPEISAELLLVAAGRAANVEDVGLETTTAEVDRGIIKVDGHMRTKEPHLYAIGDIVGGLLLAHTAAHEGIIAAHTIAGDPDVHAHGLRQAAAGDLLPPGDRLGRPDRAAVRGARPPVQGRQGPVPGRSPRRSSAASTRASPRSSRTARPTRRWASTSSGRTPPTSSPRRRSPSSSRRTPWEIGAATHAAPDALGDPRRGGDGRRRPVDQLLSATAGRWRHRMADDGPGRRRRCRGHLAASVGLADADLVAMYRTRRARPGRRRADVDPQPRRPDPVRDQRPGARGRPGRASPGRCAAATTGSRRSTARSPPASRSG